MKVLVISDIHANLPALDAVLAVPHDLLLCLGDVVGFGPDAAACVRRLRAATVVAVQGDYDRALAQGLSVPDDGALGGLGAATLPSARAQLSGDDLEWLSALPRWAITSAPGPRCLLVHGTPVDVLYGAVDPLRPSWRADVGDVGADCILVGQTHRQFHLDAGEPRVLSPGSVGLPLDGDPSAAFALIEDGVISLGRVPYLVDRTVRALGRAGLGDAVTRQLLRILQLGLPPETGAAASESAGRFEARP